MLFGPGQMGNAGERGCVRSSTLPAAMSRLSLVRPESALQEAGVISPARNPAATCNASRRLRPARAVAITEGEHMRELLCQLVLLHTLEEGVRGVAPYARTRAGLARVLANGATRRIGHHHRVRVWEVSSSGVVCLARACSAQAPHPRRPLGDTPSWFRGYYLVREQ